MTQRNQAVIVDAARTPIGRRGGAFKETRADDLAAAVLNGLIARNDLDPHAIDDVITGCVTQTGEQGLNISRNVVLAAGLPVEVTGTSVNRLCGSGVQAVAFAAGAIEAGFADVVAALGTENMTRVAMGADGGGINPAILDRFAIVNQGRSAELIAEKWELSREALDNFSYESHRRALASIDAGHFTRETINVAVEGGTVSVDETPRRGTSVEKLAGLNPSFTEDGIITAGSSSQISDGAAGVLMMSASRAKELGIKPRARIVTSATAGVDPTIMLTGPIPSTQKALARAGMSIGDIDLIECNEAFAPVPIVFAKEIGVDPERLNPRGGAIALGHPLGCTGARLLTTLLHALEDGDHNTGLVTMCIGFGQGISTIIERI